MKEFASALLVEMARAEFARRGLLPCGSMRGSPRIAEATIPLDQKRQLLSYVGWTHGLRPILEAGRGIAQLPADPVLEALRRATDPIDMFARWQRLERYVHSKHRLLMEDQSATHIVLRHCSEDPLGPRPEEDALIIGVLAILAEQAGATSLTISLLNKAQEKLIYSDGAFTVPFIAARGELSNWRFAWRPREHDKNDNCSTITLIADDRAATARAAISVVRSDPAREWTLPRLAANLAVSQRTLQRRLAAEGANVAAVIRSARVEAAGRLLIGTDLSLAKIGFICGFTDQPHFTTLFKRQTGLTPSIYRKSFA